MAIKKKENITPEGIACLIDQTLLKPQAAEADIIKLCKGALKYRFASVCVHPYYVPLCKAILRGHEVKVTTVIDFPLGASVTEAKICEAEKSVAYGADELDVVINIGAAKSGNWTYVEEELRKIIAATPSALHKIIIETCYFTQKEKELLTNIVLNAGAEFIKTSTGFGPQGAVVSDVKLMKKLVRDRIGIKAAGGIKTLAQLLQFVNAGATRIGTSSGIEIMEESMSK